MITLVAAVLCSFSTAPGVVDIEAGYLHEWPVGQTYVYTGQAFTTGAGTIEAEGWPYYIKVKRNGVQVKQCVYDPAIFIDGFETNDLSEWQ